MNHRQWIEAFVFDSSEFHLPVTSTSETHQGQNHGGSSLNMSSLSDSTERCGASLSFMKDWTQHAILVSESHAVSSEPLFFTAPSKQSNSANQFSTIKHQHVYICEEWSGRMVPWLSLAKLPHAKQIDQNPLSCLSKQISC